MERANLARKVQDSSLSHSLLFGQNLGLFVSCKRIGKLYSKFAVECDWTSKISQIRPKVLFEKKLDFFFKMDKGGKFAVECVLNNTISYKCVFHLNFEVFCKWENFKIWKIWRVVFEKKRFHPFKSHPQQNWWTENMPVVAGRLVSW